MGACLPFPAGHTRRDVREIDAMNPWKEGKEEPLLLLFINIIIIIIKYFYYHY